MIISVMTFSHRVWLNAALEDYCGRLSRRWSCFLALTTRSVLGINVIPRKILRLFVFVSGCIQIQHCLKKNYLLNLWDPVALGRKVLSAVVKISWRPRVTEELLINSIRNYHSFYMTNNYLCIIVCINSVKFKKQIESSIELNRKKSRKI